MKIRRIFCSVIPALSALLVLASCGSNGNDAPPAAYTTITGSVYAAPVNGAAVTVRNAGNTTIAGTTTNPDGTFSVTVPAAELAQDFSILSEGGVYVDEATGASTTAGALAAFVPGGTLTDRSVSLDPSTTIIHTLVTQYGKSVEDANAAFAAAFGYSPDSSMMPINAPGGTEDAAQRLAGLRAGAFSQLTFQLGMPADGQFELLAAVAQDLADDGALNGSSGLVNGSAIPEDMGNKYENALITYLSGTANLTGLKADEIGSMPFSKVALTDTYRIEYVPGAMAARQGKTAFTLNITSRSDGSPAAGLSLSLMPVMHMADRSHSTPVDAVVETAPGVYSCTVYYLMSSAMSGMSMGYWDLKVMIGGLKSAVFFPPVGMAMGSDTVRAMLKGQDDIISGMTGTEKRTYYIFNDGLTAGMGGSGALKLFIAAKESMMSYPALSSAATTTLHDENGAAWTANPVVVEASADGSNWIAASNTSGGRWSVSFSSGIVSGMTNTISLRLLVGRDGGAAEQKTTDGKAVSGSNGYQTLTATPKAM